MTCGCKKLNVLSGVSSRFSLCRALFPLPIFLFFLLLLLLHYSHSLSPPLLLYLSPPLPHPSPSTPPFPVSPSHFLPFPLLSSSFSFSFTLLSITLSSLFAPLWRKETRVGRHFDCHLTHARDTRRRVALSKDKANK